MNAKPIGSPECKAVVKMPAWEERGGAVFHPFIQNVTGVFRFSVFLTKF